MDSIHGPFAHKKNEVTFGKYAIGAIIFYHEAGAVLSFQSRTKG